MIIPRFSRTPINLLFGHQQLQTIHFGLRKMRRLLRWQEHDQSKVYCFRCQKAIAFTGVGERQRHIGPFILQLGEIMLVDARIYFHITKRSFKHDIINAQRCRCFCLHYKLVCHITFGTLRGILLAVVDACLHNPLIIERRKTRRFVKQSVHKLIGAIRFQL